VFIDHGMGVVVGETAVIGDNVTIYQGVTLGATGNERGTKRHPTVAEGAFIGSGARILGNITVGAHARVGAGSVVVKDVPSGATVVGVPARIVRQRDESGNVSPQKADERPSSEEIKGRMEAMENEIKDLRQKLSQIERKHYVEAI
jgi:serine O-acetyltransferase